LNVRKEKPTPVGADQIGLKGAGARKDAGKKKLISPKKW